MVTVSEPKVGTNRHATPMLVPFFVHFALVEKQTDGFPFGELSFNIVVKLLIQREEKSFFHLILQRHHKLLTLPKLQLPQLLHHPLKHFPPKIYPDLPFLPIPRHHLLVHLLACPLHPYYVRLFNINERDFHKAIVFCPLFSIGLFKVRLFDEVGAARET